jgi:tetratricopeptide (TPR) repeat protein
MGKKASRKRRNEGSWSGHERPFSLLAKHVRQLTAMPVAFPGILTLLTLIVWARSFAVSMVGWDDTTYFFEDGRLGALGLDNLWKIVTEPFFSNYHPLTTLTLAFDRAVWGTWVPGFHITQLFFYVGGVVAVYFFLKNLLTIPVAAFWGASLYATHTVHVESVAWLASRKDVVCLFFYVLSLLAYTSYVRQGKRVTNTYVLSLIFGIAAMLSKGYAVVLPVVLLAYDLCFARRLRLKDIAEKLPFVVAAVGLSVMTVFAQGKGGALMDLEISWLERIGALGQVFAGYVARAFLPVNLSAIYVVDGSRLDSWQAAVGIALGMGALGGFLMFRRRVPTGAFSIALFALPLGPVMNVFMTLRTWMADRYLLLPTIGSVLVLTALGMWIHGRLKQLTLKYVWIIPATAVALVLFYAGLTVSRIGVWTNPVLLWSDTMRKQLYLAGTGPVTTRELKAALVQSLPESRVAIWLAQAYKRQGNTGEASDLLDWVRTLRKTVESDDEIHLARLDIEAGKYDSALSRLRSLAEGDSWLAPIALGWMGVAYENKGQPQAAWAAHLKALNLYQDQGRPGTPALLDLAGMAFRANQFDQAAQWYQKARKEGPTDPRAVFFLGVSQERMGRVEKAFRLYEETLELEGKAAPNIPFSFVDVHLQMGLAAKRLGLLQESATHFEEWLRRAPDDPRKAMVERQLADVQVRPRGKQG